MKREEAIQVLQTALTSPFIYGEYAEAIDMAIESLSDRSTGEWIDADGNKVRLDADGHPLDSCWCSNCGEWLVASDEYKVFGKFCPNCGWTMIGGAE